MNTAPDQEVTLNQFGAMSIGGTYPEFDLHSPGLIAGNGIAIQEIGHPSMPPDYRIVNTAPAIDNGITFTEETIVDDGTNLEIERIVRFGPETIGAFRIRTYVTVSSNYSMEINTYFEVFTGETTHPFPQNEWRQVKQGVDPISGDSNAGLFYFISGGAK